MVATARLSKALLKPDYIDHTVGAMGYDVTTSMAAHRRVACSRACDNERDLLGRSAGKRSVSAYQPG